VKFSQAVVESVDFSRDIKKIRTVDGEYEALAVVVATGSVPRKLGFVGEEEFRGHGIGYCATCDGEFFTGMDVFVIGAGFAAAEEAIFLTRYARKVTVIARGSEFTCAQTIAERALAHPKIEVKFRTELLEVGGDSVPRYAVFLDNSAGPGKTWRYSPPDGDQTFGVFVFVGYVPQSAEYAHQLRLDERGYILTDENMRTNVDGVFAAGDIRPKELRQLVTAVSDGALAATCAEKYVAQKKEQLGLSDEGQSAAPRPRDSFFDAELREQLAPIFRRFENPVGVAAFLSGDDLSEDSGSLGGSASPSLDEAGGSQGGAAPLSLDEEIRAFLTEFGGLTDKVKIEFLRKGENPAREKQVNAALFPTFAVLRPDGTYAGVQFHGVPGGHEINSFILALYNAAGPGQAVEEDTLKKIQAVKSKVNLKIGVSLSCTLCPDVVAASQLIALKNPLVEAEMVDVARFPGFKNKHAIMSVPAVLVNDAKLSFGKKSLDELLALLSA
jgi:thioredoxin reductase (NADPH)